MTNLDFWFPLCLSLLVTAASGLVLVPFLRRLKLGQSIREEGPRWHMSKQGTPTMGGMMFIVGITAAVLAFGWRAMTEGEYAHLIVLGAAWAFGLIGFADDYVKVVKKRNLGLTAIQKFLLQLAVAAGLTFLLSRAGMLTDALYIPFAGVTLTLPWFVLLPLLFLFIVGFVNAVNLTDGVDGLCSGVTLPVALFFSLYCFHIARPELGLFAAVLAGGMVGFLLYNFHPAKVFMGDTGALFIGGALCGLALAVGRPLLLVPVGLIYIVETVSVVLQVVYFKLTHGRRLFRMSPIHHHFEMGGWSEKKLFFVFGGVTALLCVATFLLETI